MCIRDSLCNWPDLRSSASNCFILCHAEEPNGFVKNAKYLFKKKSSIDYHDKMDGELFEKRVLEQLLPILEKGSVIVMDNALYHSRCVEKLP